jgi:hypothetical protein
MSKHHHHPHEGHRSGTPSDKKPLHHNVFFWVGGFFILVALICFVLEGIPSLRWSAATLPPAATGSAK